MEYQERKCNARTFQLEDEPEVIHVIPSGHADKYYVLHDDAYELCSGMLETMNAEELFEKYKIKVNN